MKNIRLYTFAVLFAELLTPKKSLFTLIYRKSRGSFHVKSTSGVNHTISDFDKNLTT